MRSAFFLCDSVDKTSGHFLGGNVINLSEHQSSVGGDAHIAPQEMLHFAPDCGEFGYVQGPMWASAPTGVP